MTKNINLVASMSFMKFIYENSSLQNADFVLIGVPDHSGSHSYRLGAKKGPQAIRRVALERCIFKRHGKKSLAQVSSGIIHTKIHDLGDLHKKDLCLALKKLKGKTPIILGGDHSITIEALRNFKNVAVVYFDAHPDMISSSKGYYGSVLMDGQENTEKSIIIGVREPELEEIYNIKKKKLVCITPLHFYEKGLPWVWQQIAKRTKGKKVYISIDLDVFDPSLAPGVSTPVPGGLDFTQVLYLVKRIMQERVVVGFDIMELTPPFDQDQKTAHLAVKLLLEMIANSPKSSFFYQQGQRKF